MSEAKKVKITVDGRELEVPEGANLVEALKLHGIEIPTLCWSGDTGACLGTCRVCTAKINGRYMASCTQIVTKGMVIESETPEIKDLRRGVVELMFVEGNHYCPSCEKSGDCDLQGLGYKMGMTHARFPYRFTEYELDYGGKHLLLERNRCVHCKRCTDLFVDDQGRKVFSFVGRGAETRVIMDFNLEATLSEHKLREAVHLCPVGAILYKGQGFDRPIGTRKYDHLEKEKGDE